MERHVAFAKIKLQTPPDKEKTLNKDVPVKPNEKGTKQEKAQRRSPEKVAREESMKQGDKEKRKTVTENLEHANGSRPNSANGSNNDSQPPSEEYFLVNLDCNFILLLDHMKGRLLDDTSHTDLDLVDESGQTLNINEMTHTKKAYELLKDTATYYPAIIRKNTDGTLNNVDIYGKENFSQDVLHKLMTNIKKSVNKSRRKAAESSEQQDNADGSGGNAGTGAVTSSTTKPRRKKGEKDKGAAAND